MRFRFCGGLEPPDWVQAEVTTISSIDVEELERVARTVAQHGAWRDARKALHRRDEEVAEYEEVAMQWALFVLTQAAKYEVDESDLTVELQQLGLALRAADRLVQVYGDFHDHLRKELRQNKFKLPTIDKLSWRVRTDESRQQQVIDVKLLPTSSSSSTPTALPETSGTEEEDEDEVNHHQDKVLADIVSFTMTSDMLDALYQDLVQAEAYVQTLRG